MSVSPESDASSIRSLNWSGSIPVVISLAPASLSAPSPPPPLHRLISRMTYLHVGLRDEIRRMHAFAPALSFGYKRAGDENEGQDKPQKETENGNDGKNATPGSETQPDENESEKKADTTEREGVAGKMSPCPVCWFEDEMTGTALRWHLFVGILYDLVRDQHTKAGSTDRRFPWKIRIHFTSYPTSRLLRLDETPSPSSTSDGGESDPVMKTVERAYQQSLKQSLFLQHGSSKPAMGITKKDHGKLWDALIDANCNLHWEVGSEVAAAPGSATAGEFQGPQHVPLRLLVDGRPAVQRQCKPFIQTAEADGDNHQRKITLGDVLEKWAPIFFRREDCGDGNSGGSKGRIVPVEDSASKVRCYIQGLELPLTHPILDLWCALCHPDHFLYIVLVTRTS